MAKRRAKLTFASRGGITRRVWNLENDHFAGRDARSAAWTHQFMHLIRTDTRARELAFELSASIYGDGVIGSVRVGDPISLANRLSLRLQELGLGPHP
jgi:hypothetical protein